MSELSVEVTAFVITNRFGMGITLVLEPEGDCIEIAEGEVCRIIPAMSGAAKVECEMILGSDRSITMFLSMVKEVYVNSIKVR